MGAVVGRVEQQHSRDRHQCNGSNKDTKHCTHSPDKNCHQKTRKPPERHLRGLLGSSIGYIRQFNDTGLDISPRNRDQYVAAVRQWRDLTLPQKGQPAGQLASFTISASREFYGPCQPASSSDDERQNPNRRGSLRRSPATRAAHQDSPNRFPLSPNGSFGPPGM